MELSNEGRNSNWPINKCSQREVYLKRSHSFYTKAPTCFKTECSPHTKEAQTTDRHNDLGESQKHHEKVKQVSLTRLHTV